MPASSQVSTAAAGKIDALSHGLALLAAALTGAVAAWAMQRYVHAHIGHDQAWELYASAEVLRGVPMNGRDLVEVNPPFLLWFMSLPVLLARALHIGSIPGFRVFFLAIALSATGWAMSLFRRLTHPGPFVFWMFALLVACAGGMNMIVEDLAQREHIVIFLLLPYLLLVAMRIEGMPVTLPESIGIGLAAAVAICLKPQHLLDIAAVEALALWRLRGLKAWFHPAWAAFSLGLIAYFCAVRLLVPSYFTEVVPLLRSTYWGFDSPMRAVLYAQRRSMLALASGALFMVVLRTRLRMATLEAVLLVAGTGALAAYIQQHKAWTYQMICVEFLTVLSVGLIVTDLLDRALAQLDSHPRGPLRPIYPAAALLGGALLSLMVAVRQHEPDSYPEWEKADLATIYAAYPAGTDVGFLSVYPWQFPAVLEQDKVWASRYFHLWMLPAILRSGDPADGDLKHHLSEAELQHLSALLRSAATADLARWQPAVVVTQACGPPSICDGLQRQHLASVLDWFLVDPGFRAEWAHYQAQRTLRDLTVYTRTP